MKAEERAEKLVRVDNVGGLWTIWVGHCMVDDQAPDEAGANNLAQKVRRQVAEALEAHAQAAVAEALRVGLRGAPVSEGRVKVIRDYAEWRVKVIRDYAEWRDGDLRSESSPPATGQVWAQDVFELCRLIDHLQAKVALMVQDGGWRDGYEAGKAEAQREARER
jgi:hypothetical protein